MTPSVCRIQRGREVVKLEPRVMQVLEFLARHPGEPVSRGELEAGVWGDRVVGYEALGRTVAQLRKALGDDARRPQFIETLSKKGYRLVAPVEVVVDTGEGAHTGLARRAGATRAKPGGSRTPLLVAAVTIATLLVAAAGLWPVIREADKPKVADATQPASIAVLPFANLSPDPEQSHVADGITDDLTTALTKISGLFVIARHTTFKYRGPPVDLRGLAGELGVRYLLHGSVQREAERLRINAQLTDAATATQVWAETYNGSVADIFGLQDHITQNVVSVLAVNLTADERRQLARRDTTDLEAYELFLRGRERYYRFSREDNRAARMFYQEAIALDPAFARAYAMLALTYRQDVVNGWSEDHEAALSQAMTLAEQAMSLNEALPEAYFVKGLVHRERKEFADALMAAERAIEIDPNYADGHIVLGSVLYLAGQPEQGLKRVERAMRLNPLHPHNYQLCQGQALYLMGSYDRAIGAFVEGLERYPESERLHVWLAAAYAQTGQADDARWEMDQVYTLNPGFSLSYLEEASAFRYQADLESFLEGIRKAMRVRGDEGVMSGGPPAMR